MSNNARSFLGILGTQTIFMLVGRRSDNPMDWSWAELNFQLLSEQYRILRGGSLPKQVSSPRANLIAIMRLKRDLPAYGPPAIMVTSSRYRNVGTTGVRPVSGVSELNMLFPRCKGGQPIEVSRPHVKFATVALAAMGCLYYNEGGLSTGFLDSFSGGAACESW